MLSVVRGAQLPLPCGGYKMCGNPQEAALATCLGARFIRTAMRTARRLQFPPRGTGKKTPGGVGTHTGHTGHRFKDTVPEKRHRGEPGHTQDTRAHTGTRITQRQTNLTTIQTQRHIPRGTPKRASRGASTAQSTARRARPPPPSSRTTCASSRSPL